MKSAISASDLIPVDGTRIAVLGDIEDVGEISPEMHQEVIKAVDDSKFNVLLTIGEKMRRATSEVACRSSLSIKNFDNLDDLAAAVKLAVKPGDLVLFKASHASHLEKCVLKVWPQYTKDFGVFSGLFHKWRDSSLFN
jgi:UDP-N-acetylmuramoyl-tripeptide--D-alanyl-D-alanine ligase